MNEFIFDWVIENISYSWHTNLERISSPPFVANTLQNTVWTLNLNPNTGFNSEDFLGMYLIRGEDDGPRDFFFDCEFACVSQNNLVLETIFPVRIASGMSSMYFLKRDEVFVRRKALYLPQDILTLRCRMWKSEGDIYKLGQSLGRTRLETERIQSVEYMNPRITRKTLLIRSKNQDKLLLTVETFREVDCLKVKIHRRATAKIKFSTFKFSAVGRNGNKLDYIDSWLQMPVEVAWTMPFSNTEKASVQNKLKLTCEFMYSTGEETNLIDNLSPCSFNNNVFLYCILSCIPSKKMFDCPNMYKDLWRLFSKGILCDVELKTQSTSCWVHKTVLCARSPVFSAMFTGEMKEKASKYIEIEDLENDTLKKFLAFLYTDSFEESQFDEVVKLYCAAVKYQVKRLKFVCCSYFMNNIDSVPNVCELLMLADKQSDSHLKSRLEDYIRGHLQWIFESSSWEEFSETQPLLAAKTMQSEYKKPEKETDEFELSSYPNAMGDFKSLYESQADSDIIIQSTDNTFPAHKTILCAGSSTLRRIISRRKPPNSLKVDDLEEDTVFRLLMFLYTDSLGDVEWEDVTKLYHAAVAYQIERLKIQCSCFLLKNLDATNASHLLQLAQEHRDAKLKSLVEDYIFLKDLEITSSKGCSKAGKTDPPKRIETRLSKRLKLADDS